MARLNVAVNNPVVLTHEGARADMIKPEAALRRTLLTCLLWEDTFYESGDNIAKRLASYVPLVSPHAVASLAVQARNQFKLRHAPLFLIRELARIKGTGPLVRAALADIVQRPDELAEFLAIYWKDGRQPLSAGVKKGLAQAFTKFNEYQIAKWNRANVVKLRDVLFLTHPKPSGEAQAELWKHLANGTLTAPDTWEVALSGGADKRATFERLLREQKLGGMAVLQNLRNMIDAGVDQSLISERLSRGIHKALPFRFITAARHAHVIKSAIETAMLKAVENLPPIPGNTGLLVDVSGSMYSALSGKSETTRLDAACGLAILLREKAHKASIATFSNDLVTIPDCRGFALRDAILNSQDHSATRLGYALLKLKDMQWDELDRIIVITDEQTADTIPPAFAPHCYIINVAPYDKSIGNKSGWLHINGWSERVLDYMVELENE
jgi:hypothetical protein